MKTTRINRNELARAVTLAEGGKISLPIGQVKEVIRLTLRELVRHGEDATLMLLRRVEAERVRVEEKARNERRIR